MNVDIKKVFSILEMADKKWSFKKYVNYFVNVREKLMEIHYLGFLLKLVLCLKYYSSYERNDE